MNLINDRYTARAVEASARPKKVYSFWVTGHGAFPTDMLRYDACWPADQDSASGLVFYPPGYGSHDERRRLLTENRSIKLYSYREPTPDRWWSFGWSCSAEKF